MKGLKFETKTLPIKLDDIAPDGSEIRLLLTRNGGGLCHCRLQPFQTSTAVKHKTVEEIWYFLTGKGQVWRKQGKRQKVVNVKRGVSLTIPVGTHFQFRNVGKESLTFIIVTMPPWPGKQEAVSVRNHWSVA